MFDQEAAADLCNVVAEDASPKAFLAAEDQCGRPQRDVIITLQKLSLRRARLNVAEQELITLVRSEL